ncbi:MAG TPA: hypothetical protein VFW59_10760, partial [Gallionella sp.]|nr:hypothetical protein [Gallionella sp.]
NTTVDLRVFSDLLSKGMFPHTGGTFVNGLSAEYRGIEATLKHSFDEVSELTLNLAHGAASSNGASMAAAGFTGLGSSCVGNNDILACSIPKDSASALYSRQFSGEISVSAAYYYQASMQPFDRGIVDLQPTQHRTDVRIAKALRDVGGLRGDVALVVQNLFDQTYTDYVANSLNNRRAYATLTVNW